MRKAMGSDADELCEFLLRCARKQALAMRWFYELDCQGPNPGSALGVVLTGHVTSSMPQFSQLYRR